MSSESGSDESFQVISAETLVDTATPGTSEQDQAGVGPGAMASRPPQEQASTAPSASESKSSSSAQFLSVARTKFTTQAEDAAHLSVPPPDNLAQPAQNLNATSALSPSVSEAVSPTRIEASSAPPEMFRGFSDFDSGSEASPSQLNAHSLATFNTSTEVQKMQQAFNAVTIGNRVPELNPDETVDPGVPQGSLEKKSLDAPHQTDGGVASAASLFAGGPESATGMHQESVQSNVSAFGHSSPPQGHGIPQFEATAQQPSEGNTYMQQQQHQENGGSLQPDMFSPQTNEPGLDSHSQKEDMFAAQGQVTYPAESSTHSEGIVGSQAAQNEAHGENAAVPMFDVRTTQVSEISPPTSLDSPPSIPGYIDMASMEDMSKQSVVSPLPPASNLFSPPPPAAESVQNTTIQAPFSDNSTDDKTPTAAALFGGASVESEKQAVQATTVPTAAALFGEPAAVSSEQFPPPVPEQFPPQVSEQPPPQVPDELTAPAPAMQARSRQASMSSAASDFFDGVKLQDNIVPTVDQNQMNTNVTLEQQPWQQAEGQWVDPNSQWQTEDQGGQQMMDSNQWQQPGGWQQSNTEVNNAQWAAQPPAMGQSEQLQPSSFDYSQQSAGVEYSQHSQQTGGEFEQPHMGHYEQSQQNVPLYGQQQQQQNAAPQYESQQQDNQLDYSQQAPNPVPYDQQVNPMQYDTPQHQMQYNQQANTLEHPPTIPQQPPMSYANEDTSFGVQVPRKDSKLSSGYYSRPARAVVSFGFGGRLIVMQPIQQKVQQTRLVTRSSMDSASSNASLGTFGKPTLRNGPVAVYSLKNLVVHPNNGLLGLPKPLEVGRVAHQELAWFMGEKLKEEVDEELEGTSKLMWSLLQLLLRSNGMITDELIRFRFGKTLLSGEVVHQGQTLHIFEPIDTPTETYAKRHPQDPQQRVYLQQHMEMLMMQGQREAAVVVAIENDMWAQALIMSQRVSTVAFLKVVGEYAEFKMQKPCPTRALFTVYAERGGDLVDRTIVDEAEIRADWRIKLSALLSTFDHFTNGIVETLGDRLWDEVGSVMAAHVCYLLAQLPIGTSRSKFVLIGGDHRYRPDKFATVNTIQMTECYMYIKQLFDTSFVSVPYQKYRLLYARWLADYGYTDLAREWVRSVQGNIEKSRGFKDGDSLSEELEVFNDRLHVGNGFPGSRRERENSKSGSGGFMGKMSNFFRAASQEKMDVGPKPAPVTAPPSTQQDPFAVQKDPFAKQQDPFAKQQNQFPAQQDPFAKQQDAYTAQQQDPFATPMMPARTMEPMPASANPAPVPMFQPTQPSGPVPPLEQPPQAAPKEDKAPAPPSSKPPATTTNKPEKTSPKPKQVRSSVTSSIFKKITKWVNPNVKVVEGGIGSNMEAYYDPDRGWIFPDDKDNSANDDVAKMKKAGPPTMTPVQQQPAGEQAALGPNPPTRPATAPAPMGLNQFRALPPKSGSGNRRQMSKLRYVDPFKTLQGKK